jgi:hypothetical protein
VHAHLREPSAPREPLVPRTKVGRLRSPDVEASSSWRVRPEHEERFRRIAKDYLERPGGDYAELLRRGRVTSPEGVDPEEWRAESGRRRVRTRSAWSRSVLATVRSQPGIGRSPRSKSSPDCPQRSSAVRCSGALPSAHDSWATRLSAGSDTTGRASRCVLVVRPGVTSGSMPTRRSWMAKLWMTPVGPEEASP